MVQSGQPRKQEAPLEPQTPAKPITIWPRIVWNAQYITTMVAVFGTTISPYLFFWQASQEVEQQQATPGARPLVEAPNQARANFRVMGDFVVSRRLRWLGRASTGLMAVAVLAMLAALQG